MSRGRGAAFTPCVRLRRGLRRFPVVVGAVVRRVGSHLLSVLRRGWHVKRCRSFGGGRRSGDLGRGCDSSPEIRRCRHRWMCGVCSARRAGAHHVAFVRVGISRAFCSRSIRSSVSRLPRVCAGAGNSGQSADRPNLVVVSCGRRRHPLDCWTVANLLNRHLLLCFVARAGVLSTPLQLGIAEIECLGRLRIGRDLAPVRSGELRCRSDLA